jgi:hypothetical protein
MSRRVIALPDLYHIDEHSANTITQGRAKKCAQYFHTFQPYRHKLHTIVHGFIGTQCATSYSYVIIVGSHHHIEFFNSLHRHGVDNKSLPLQSNTTWYPHLKLSEVNAILSEVRNINTTLQIAQKIRTDLTNEQTQALPESFSLACIQLDKPCLIIINPKTIRCGTSQESNTVRWKTMYKCISNNSTQTSSICHDDLQTDFPGPESARNYEKYTRTQTPWPKLLTSTTTPQVYDPGLQDALRCKLDEYGVVLIPLCPLRTQKYVNIMSTYLKNLMQWPNHVNILDVSLMKTVCADYLPEVLPQGLQKNHLFRYSRQRQSKHIPATHGFTKYGHYCEELENLLDDIQIIITHAFSVTFPEDKHIWVTTAELIVEC